MIEFLQKHLSPSSIERLRAAKRVADKVIYHAKHPYFRYVQTPVLLAKNNGKPDRKLEIGPGIERISGFETVNVVSGDTVDYVADASKNLPFRSDEFSVVYASHILEHIPWYKVKPVLEDWVRVLKPGGCLEIWVPDGLKIMETFVKAEHGEGSDVHRDGWYKFNDAKDPCVWANGRAFSYGDGTGRKNDPNWHLGLFSPRYLKELLEGAGLVDIERLDNSQVRGYDHGWINLGFRGRKLM